MKILKLMSLVFIASMTLANCSSTKTATTYNANNTKEIAIISTTNNIIAKQGELVKLILRVGHIWMYLQIPFRV